MIRGLDTNRIIVGAYVDPRSGGICPMLAAHRNGGRTDVASFARAWDEYTNARRPRRATRREVRALRNLLAESLELGAMLEHTSIAELAAQIRAERETFRCAVRPPPSPRLPTPVAAAEDARSGGADGIPAAPEADVTREGTPASQSKPPPAAPALLPDEPAGAAFRVKRTAQLERRAEGGAGARPGWRRPGARGEIKDLLAAAEEQLATPPPPEPVGDRSRGPAR